MNLPKGYIELNGTTLLIAADAVMFDFGIEEHGMPKSIWIPKSQLEDWPDKGENGEVLITEWIAGVKGLI